MRGSTPADVGFVETHGTGTRARRSHRGRGHRDRGRPVRAGSGPLLPRRRQGQPRPPRGGRRSGRFDQERPRVASRGGATASALHKAEPPHLVREHPARGGNGVDAVASGSGAPLRRREFLRRGRHERARCHRRSAEAAGREARARRRASDPAALGCQPGGADIRLLQPGSIFSARRLRPPPTSAPRPPNGDRTSTTGSRWSGARRTNSPSASASGGVPRPRPRVTAARARTRAWRSCLAARGPSGSPWGASCWRPSQCSGA